MELKKMGSKLRKKKFVILLALLIMLGVAFGAYAYQAQQQELQKVKNESEELSKRLDKIMEVSPTPTATPTIKLTPTPLPTHKAVKLPTPTPFYFPKPIFPNQPINNTSSEDLQQNENIESICTNSGGHILFGECEY